MEVNSNLLVFLSELRKSVRLLGGAVILGTAALYVLSATVLTGLQNHLDQSLAFFAVPEPFLAHVKLSFFVTLFVLMPGILYCLWMALGKPFKLEKSTLAWFVFFTTILFYLGAGFCYFITLPYGVKFLLGFQSTQLKPVISISKFVNFVTIFILAFGAIFQLPIFMVFAARVGICSRQSFEKHRRYAVLIISIMAALLTPTPDIVNMLLMGGPLYLLYEIGILVIRSLKI
ncbi:MAG: twin-arginine translocase subunit TatC [Deltaproteobacteria bacterium]|jgi:sec-independent protein translocase protein TatC|nr:twin-arginine translocase subunit TatC [Deltaproteobacteria bacterium]